MGTETIIQIEGLYKKFSRSLKRSMMYGAMDLSRSFLGIPINQGRLRKTEFWSLEDINMELKSGETLGIIGINGAGKSTLLRLISGIYPPDKGKIIVKGRIGSLIAVGAGFHPHLSGRENIFLNGTILGMTRKEIEAKFKDIISFADIGEFLDAPVSTYSSGMRVRLGFSIAVHCEPDILLVDEILSVGDITFRNKSARKLKELRDKAKGIVFVSHNLEQIANISDRVIVLDKGRIIFEGKPGEAILKYYEITSENQLDSYLEQHKTQGEHISSGDVRVVSINVLDSGGKSIKELTSDSDIRISYKFDVINQITKPRIASAIRDDANNNVIWQINLEEDFELEILEPGSYELIVEYTSPSLASGIYHIVFNLQNAETLEYYEKLALKNVYSFRIKNKTNKMPRGIIACKSKWSIKKIEK